MTCTYSKEFSTSSFTDIENTFINEYMPIATGNAVKVYLYGLFLCQNPQFDQSLEDISTAIKINVDEVLDCFKFWEDFGLVNIISKDPFCVQFLPVRQAYSTKPRKIESGKYSDFTKGIQALLPNRMISMNEYTEYFNIMEVYSIKPEAMLMIVKYCVDIKGDDIGYRYISKVAKDFGTRGITTVSKIENELSSYISRTNEISKILRALSLKRQPEIEDLNLFKKWTQELNFEVESIIFVASTIKKGGVNKLDEVLTEMYSQKCFSKEEIKFYIANKQRVYDLAIKINKALSIYVEVLDTEINTYLNKWISLGYEEDALLYIASVCFKDGNNTLQFMDGLVDKLYEKGIINLTSVGDYFENIKEIDKLIEKILINAGVNRRPVSWDREQLNTWRSWNFSDEMILEAAKMSSGKSSPIAYINGILSNWKNNEIYSLSSVAVTSNSADNSQEAYNREYERRRGIALSRAQKNNQIAMSIEGFSDVYSRLNSLERDLAFAEINGNTEQLKLFEQEKETLLNKGLNMLKEKDLTFEDLSPKYACSKCNDTGYVGTHRCDCFDKTV